MGGWGLALSHSPSIMCPAEPERKTIFPIQKQLLVPWRLQSPQMQFNKIATCIFCNFPTVIYCNYQEFGVTCPFRLCDLPFPHLVTTLTARLQTKAILGTSIIGHLLGAKKCQRPRKDGEIMTYHDEKNNA